MFNITAKSRLILVSWGSFGDLHRATPLLCRGPCLASLNWHVLGDVTWLNHHLLLVVCLKCHVAWLPPPLAHHSHRMADSDFLPGPHPLIRAGEWMSDQVILKVYIIYSRGPRRGVWPCPCNFTPSQKRGRMEITESNYMYESNSEGRGLMVGGKILTKQYGWPLLASCLTLGTMTDMWFSTMTYPHLWEGVPRPSWGVTFCNVNFT